MTSYVTSGRRSGGAKQGRRTPVRARACARLAAALAPLAVGACSDPPAQGGSPLAVPAPYADFLAAGDWPSYNRDLAGTRYSPLAQIDVSNVAALTEAWRYPLPRHASADGVAGGYELTPLVVNGVMYVAAADRIVALAGDTGAELWRHPVRGEPPSRRGVTYWPGDAETSPRLFYTAGRRLAALDAATGEPVPAFGGDGVVEMPVAYHSPPTRFENLLIVGSDSPPGGVRAFNARTGAQAWLFDAVPQPGEAGHETWQSDAWRGASVQHPAPSLTVDVDRALVYAVFDSPGTDDHYGGDRPGATLFANSIVALDARTGALRWHFQTVHHDVWDYGLPAPPTLLDVVIGGETVPVLAQPSKQGYLYVLNRVTGVPVFGVEERTVPQSDVPGEQTSPTQPIPAKPPPLARVSFAAGDMVTAADTTPEHAAFCRELRDRGGGLRNDGPFTPYGYRAPGAAPRTTIVFPGAAGGAGWGGAAADPTLGFVFVNTMDEGGVGWIEPAGEEPDGPAASAAGRPPPYRRGSAVGGPLARFVWNAAAPDSDGQPVQGSDRAWPCQKPPWGRLTAVSAVTGEIAWQVPLGITPELPEGKQRTGRPNLGGPIATAGGLVFIAATNDRRFRAFAAETGEELWSAELPLSAHAVPITYEAADGRQYVGVVAGGASGIDDQDTGGAQALVVYALP